MMEHLNMAPVMNEAFSWSLRPGKSLMFLALASSSPLLSQERHEHSLFHDLFRVEVHYYEGEPYLNTGPDSLKADPIRGPLCASLWNAHSYLYTNYSEVFRHETELLALLPDTVALQKQFDDLLDTDTSFQRTYLPSFKREMVAPLHIDSALHIAAHFFYLHRVNEKVTMHVCIGINKVKTLSAAPAYPYYAAFCYMAIWGMEDFSMLYQKMIEPYKAELRGNPTDERLQELEQLVYDELALDPQLRKVLLDEYARKAEYLNFDLVR